MIALAILTPASASPRDAGRVATIDPLAGRIALADEPSGLLARLVRLLGMAPDATAGIDAEGSLDATERGAGDFDESRGSLEFVLERQAAPGALLARPEASRASTSAGGPSTDRRRESTTTATALHARLCRWTC